jgi:hypothetical protein
LLSYHFLFLRFLFFFRISSTHFSFSFRLRLSIYLLCLLAVILVKVSSTIAWTHPWVFSNLTTLIQLRVLHSVAWVTDIIMRWVDRRLRECDVCRVPAFTWQTETDRNHRNTWWLIFFPVWTSPGTPFTPTEIFRDGSWMEVPGENLKLGKNRLHLQSSFQFTVCCYSFIRYYTAWVVDRVGDCKDTQGKIPQDTRII